ncbi:hypothetical protein [Kribbella solani]|uniref:hypothetical protein n=1 Tax=Kribbella solani TaxID=236067 RepID=UPI0029A833EE|nr:hypothetical protein [Kribbella solani]MDX2974742.1 hypothetical protein [Kribbella solani]
MYMSRGADPSHGGYPRSGVVPDSAGVAAALSLTDLANLRTAQIAERITAGLTAPHATVESRSTEPHAPVNPRSTEPRAAAKSRLSAPRAAVKPGRPPTARPRGTTTPTSHGRDL